MAGDFISQVEVSALLLGGTEYDIPVQDLTLDDLRRRVMEELSNLRQQRELLAHRESQWEYISDLLQRVKG